MRIRRVVDNDLALIRSVQAAAFGRGAGREPVEAGVVDALYAAGDLVEELTFVALDGVDVVGNVACSVGDLDGRRLVCLGPLGVRPDRQRAGVGSALVRAALDAAEVRGEPAIVLLGSPAYYGRFGFELAADYRITPTEPAWRSGLQVRRLTAWDASLRGTFRFPPAFP